MQTPTLGIACGSGSANALASGEATAGSVRKDEPHKVLCAG